ncbi:MAG: MATE family efflux transporter [Clostridia bacterium]|nr:MATE family efflux transporter [Clostridia bacterium]
MTANRIGKADFTSGPLFGKMLMFTLPLMLSGILQLLFSAADMVVVGQFVSSQAVAAIGATYSLTNLMVNLFMGLSVGTSVSVSQGLGARDDEMVSRVVHTSIAVSLIGGALIGAFGFFTSRQLLAWMDTPADLLDQSTLYMKIYFLGMPATALYNFAGAVLRSAGDTRRPLYFLVVAGVLNVLLNLFFVIVCGMKVEGVALATVASQAVSAVLTVWWLCRLDTAVKVRLRAVRVHAKTLLRLLKIGLPAGFQGTLFALSNVLIQSSVNSFQATVMAGNAASASIEGFEYVALNATHHTALTFTGQNVGARRLDRLWRVLGISLLLELLIGLVFYGAFELFGHELLGLYVPDNPAAIPYGWTRLEVFAYTYALCGIMDVMVGALRGLGASVSPMIVSLLGVCGFRILWIYTVFAAYRPLLTDHESLRLLYASYPISWLLTFAILLLCYAIFYRNLKRKFLQTP